MSAYLGAKKVWDSSATSCDAPKWERPADWLSLPEITDGSNVFFGLVAVYPVGYSFAILKAEGAIQVDWGDGVVENVASGYIASHVYDYNSTALDGSECARGYKQAIVTVTSQLGETLTSLDLSPYISKNFAHTTPAPEIGDFSPSTWLDIAVHSETLSSLNVGHYSYCRTPALEHAYIYAPNIPTADSLFYNCYNLCKVSRLRVYTAASAAKMFYNCHRLVDLPAILGFANLTDAQYMFAYCHALEKLPEFDVTTVTNAAGFCRECTALKTLTHVRWYNANLLDYAFYKCSNLSGHIELWVDYDASMSNTFRYCTGIESFVLHGCVYSLYYTFRDCSRMRSFKGTCLSRISSSGVQTAFTTRLLGSVELTNMDVNLELLGHAFNADTLNALFASLKDASVSENRKITILNTPALLDPAYDPTIATAKNWEVVVQD